MVLAVSGTCPRVCLVEMRRITRILYQDLIKRLVQPEYEQTQMVIYEAFRLFINW